MNRLFIVILILLFLMFFFTKINFIGDQHLMSESMMALGFTLITAYLIGKFFTRFQLPKLTGYIIAGILTGPYLINLLSSQVVQNLQLIDEIALSLIALTAGGEFRYKEIKPQMKNIIGAITGKIVLVLAGFVIIFSFLGNHINFLKDETIYATLGVGLIIGAISFATSPATVIGIIAETKAKGRFTDFVLGVTIFKDILVVLVFSIILSFSQPLISGESSIQLHYIINVLLELVISFAIGIATGALILFYIKFIDIERAFFLLGIILLGIEASKILHIKLVLVFMVAGFFVQNFSNSGAKLIEGIEKSSLTIYVVFFSIAGATLNLKIFIDNWFIAILIVILRLFTTYYGTYVGTKITNAPQEIQQYSWMGFIGQAGLSLGFAVMVTQNIPGAIGLNIKTLILSAIAINQIIGPVLFRLALIKVGETNE